MARQDRRLASPTEGEDALADELRTQIREITSADSDSTSAGTSTWNANMRELQRLVATSDPRDFLSWGVVGGSMFIKYAKFSRFEYRYLRQRPDWPRWERALKESRAGNPPRCPFDERTSCNLVHHAYHLAQFEQHTGEDVAQFDVVVEFGGGYGSMCRLFFNLGFRGRYVIFDLPAVSALQRYFLKSTGIRVLTPSEFAEGANGAICVSEFPELASLDVPGRRLFVATWSLSESPLAVRNAFLNENTARFDSVLLAFQPKFDDIDNVAYFDSWCEMHPELAWQRESMRHLPNQQYLFAKRRATQR